LLKRLAAEATSQCGFSTIERWYYRALRERTDPVVVLRRKVRVNAGLQHAVSDAVRQAVLAQYAAHKSWSVQLHHDNLVALAEQQPDLKPVPSYPTLRRFMRAIAVAACRGGIKPGRSRQAPASDAANDRGGRTRRSPYPRSRDPQLRGRVCGRPMALGLPPLFEEGADGTR